MLAGKFLLHQPFLGKCIWTSGERCAAMQRTLTQLIIGTCCLHSRLLDEMKAVSAVLLWILDTFHLIVNARSVYTLSYVSLRALETGQMCHDTFSFFTFTSACCCCCETSISDLVSVAISVTIAGRLLFDLSVILILKEHCTSRFNGC